MKTARLKETLPVRLPDETHRRLKIIAAAAGITLSDALRMAIGNGLPDLEAGRIKLNPKTLAARK